MASNAGASTPARVTRARSKTPLPAVGPRESHAYGAQGKANLRRQMRPSGGDFGTAFQTTRVEEEVEEEQPVVAAAPSQPRKRAGRPRKATAQSQADSEAAEMQLVREASTVAPEAPEAPIPERTETVMTTGANYVAQQQDRQSEMRADRTTPSNTRIFARTLPVFLLELVQFTIIAFSFIVLALTIYAFVSLPPEQHLWRDNFFHGLKRAVNITEEPIELVDAMWAQFKHDKLFSQNLPVGMNLPELQWAINIEVHQRLEEIEQEIGVLKGELKLQTETIELLKEIIPSQVVLRKVNGEYEIPLAFWQALQDKMIDNHDIADRWTTYLSENSRQIEDFNRNIVSDELNQQMEKRHILTRDEFVELTQQNNDYMAEQYNKEYQELWAKNFDYLKELVEEKMREIASKSPDMRFARQQVDMLAKINQFENAHESLHSINWFSVGTGARIDPGQTSPTYHPPAASWLASVFRMVNPVAMPPKKPIEALLHWEEATDCWCGLLDKKGYVQIGVLTNTKIHPHQLIVEHVPAEGTLNIAAAPRSLELWMEASSKKEKRRIKALVKERLPLDHELRCGERPGPNFICVGQGEYDIHDANYVQRFPTWYNLESYDFASNHFVVRAATNWGANWTCIYRVRMAGTRLE